MKRSLKKKVSEATSNIFRGEKDKWVELNPSMADEVEDELFNLIQTAYEPIGGHVNFKTPKDIFFNGKSSHWEVVDIDDDPYADVVFIGKKTPFGIKYTASGHDGSKDARRYLLKTRAYRQKNEIGHYAEVSGKFAEILIKKYGVEPIYDEDVIRKVLNKDITYLGDGWYEREIAGKYHKKILIGTPKV